MDKLVAKELAAIAGAIPPTELNPIHFQALVNRWRKTRSRSTASGYRSALARLVRNMEILTRNPGLSADIPKVPGPTPRRTIAAPGELQILLDNANPWMRVIIALAAYAGLRKSDAMRVAPANYDDQKQTITLHQKKTDEPLTVPVVPELAAILHRTPTGDPGIPFARLARGKPVYASTIANAWVKLRQKSAINPKVTLHDLRRTLAVDLYEVSKDLRAVEQMLGHKSLATTIRYLEHRDPEKLRPYLNAIIRPMAKVIQ